MEMPKARQGIHPEGESGEKHKEVAKQCDSCKNYFLVNNETQTKLGEEDLKKLQEMIKAKTGISPNLDTFTCQHCSTEIKPESTISFGRKKTTNPADENSIGKKKVLAILIPILVLIAGFILSSFMKNKERSFEVKVYKETPDVEVFEDELYALENTYNKQLEKVWISLASGIKSILKTKPNRPSVFLMLYDTDSAGNTAKCIAQDVSKAATKLLMQRSKTPVMVTGADLHESRFLDDPGLLLTEYNNTIRERGVLIMTNLQDIPPEVAKSLHFFCDKYSPLIEKAVFFFTLRVVQLHGSNEKQQAENRLQELWNEKIEDNALHPLITRMTSNVLIISSDSANC